MAANQSGKTLASAIEVACHATGKYPPWWPGKRFDKPTTGWVAAVTGEVMRDSYQRLLLGENAPYGGGTIPKACIIDTTTARGISGLCDVIKVAHVSGGISTITLKSYSAGRERFQGATLDYVALDEEPPYDIFSECQTRLNATKGILFMTFTPLQGVSEVVRLFMFDPSPDMALIRMTIDDCDHFDEAMKQQIIGSYQPHELESRVRGEPGRGSGLIFPVTRASIECDHRSIPDHWPRLIGVDFGFVHNFAAAEIAIDRDHDCCYVVRTFRQKESTPIMHAAALRAWGRHLRVAWPRDGRRQTLEGAGIPLMTQYKEQGLDMLWEHAQFEDGSVSVEAGLVGMLDAMRSGRFKVFRELNDFWEEFNLYHRKDGVVFAERDDLLCAVRYAWMMLRYAQTKEAHSGWNRDLKYSNDPVV
jgi:phage terminase large subunit-like protein